MEEGPRLSVVVAVKDRPETLAGAVAALGEAMRPGVELIFPVAGSAPEALAARGPEWRMLEAPAESLVPHLWRDGLLAARAARVAFTNARFMPPAGWIDALLAADLDRWAAVGGPIAMAGGAGAADWAIYFLRYSAFAPPLAAGEVREVAADNAVYRRDALMAHSDLLADGFWEPAFHARFRAEGLGLGVDPRLISTFAGGERPGRFMRHRIAHGRAFGWDRGRGASPARRLALAAASPAVPAVLLWRIVRRAARDRTYAAPLLRAFPWLAAFACAWALGEARGYLDALGGRGPEAQP
jgi:hypothetical protein